MGAGLVEVGVKEGNDEVAEDAEAAAIAAASALGRSRRWAVWKEGAEWVKEGAGSVVAEMVKPVRAVW